MNHYQREIGYELDLLGSGDETTPADAGRVVTGIAQLHCDAAEGNEKAQGALRRVNELFDVARKRRRWADELSRRVKIQNGNE